MEEGPPEPIIKHYYQLAGYNLAIAILFPVLNVIVVSTRFYVRKRQKVPLQADDWLTIPALVSKRSFQNSKSRSNEISL
jgi:hypothetical protein